MGLVTFWSPSSGAAITAYQPLPGAALVSVGVDFTSNWNANPPSYTDVTSDIRMSSGLVWERGRNDEYQSVSPGTCDFTLSNRSRTYDPTTNANMVPARPMLVTCYYPTTSTAYKQFDGMVEDWTPGWTLGKDSVVQANAVERWGGLAFCRIASTGYLPTTDVRVRLGQLADAAGWPSGLRSFAAGSYNLLAQTIQNTDTLSAMQETANGQIQVLYQTRDGTLKTAGSFSTVSASGKTFGDDQTNILAGTELQYAGIGDGVGGGYLYTQVQLTAAGSAWVSGQPNTVTKNVGTPYTIAKYGTRVYSRNVAAYSQTDTTSAAGSLATSLAAQASYRVKSVVIKPLANPANLFPVVLNADLGTSYTFKLQPVGGGARWTQTAVVRSIRHEITADNWTVTWGLSPT